MACCIAFPDIPTFCLFELGSSNGAIFFMCRKNLSKRWFFIQTSAQIHWLRGAETAELVEYPGQATGTSQKIVLTALGGSTATPAEGIVAEVVVVNNFDELKTLGRDEVAGKIVLFNERFDKQKSAAGQAFAAHGEAVRHPGARANARAGLGAGAPF